MKGWHIASVSWGKDSPVARWARVLREALGGDGRDHAADDRWHALASVNGLRDEPNCDEKRRLMLAERSE